MAVTAGAGVTGATIGGPLAGGAVGGYMDRQEKALKAAARDGVALHGGPYHFFDRSSRIAATSSICSASSFFSFAFSSSSCFSFFISGGSMPAYFFFQLK